MSASHGLGWAGLAPEVFLFVVVGGDLSSVSAEVTKECQLSKSTSRFWRSPMDLG